MKHRITVQVPVEKRGLFGRKKIVYEDRTLVVDGPTYRKFKQMEKDAELEDFLDFIEEMEIVEAILDD